jgi:type I restriction enzyme S subunit
MSEWKCYKLNEISSLSNGINFDKSAYTSGVKLIGVSDFKDRIHPDYDSLQEVDSKVVKSGDYLEKGDIVFVRSNGNKELVGRCMMIDRDIPVTYSGFCIKLRLKDKKLFEPVFFNYLFKTRQFKKSMTGTAVGANIQNLSQSRLGSCEVNVPDIETQKEIATILSRYDSLIENYQKQIKLLEEAAQRLYKEWFVDLHFPGHENTKIVDGVPEGWEKKPALDFFEMSIGKTPPRAQKQWFTKVSNGIPWVSISDMKDTMFVQKTAEELTQDACENYNIKVVPKGTILLSFKLTVGRVAFAGADVCTNEAIAHFQKEGDEWKAYTLMYLRNYNYDSLGNTSGISKAVNSTIIKNMPFVMPCTAILQEFSQRVLPFIKQTENLQTQIRLLTEARDRLLPKLMSGEIEI